MDVKTAFLNAEMDMEMEKEETILMVQPPPFLVEKQLVDRHTLFMPTKALYSPQGTGLSIGMEFSNPRELLIPSTTSTTSGAGNVTV